MVKLLRNTMDGSKSEQQRPSGISTGEGEQRWTENQTETVVMEGNHATYQMGRVIRHVFCLRQSLLPESHTHDTRTRDTQL